MGRRYPEPGIVDKQFPALTLSGGLKEVFTVLPG
jgi:hypothetical protein